MMSPVNTGPMATSKEFAAASLTG